MGSPHDYMSTTKNLRPHRGLRDPTQENADYAFALYVSFVSSEGEHIALFGAPIAALAQGLAAVAEALGLLRLVGFVVESCPVGGQDTVADCLHFVDLGVSRISCPDHGAIRAIEALPGATRTRPSGA
jgi:hypothetical protein